ncbi:hypothetical protein HELRODRAFT_155964 [Helobdella robusta]|uniref:Methyltransferase domain-containing protein n=1 Tax=Helobdella robusta TaxID=6412 RepID=T1ELQ0_HELRO|nr:hypothetical protein HELRODRAFT_155964 [Helobdella robusta]ESN99225.1 hypothetical protein HELRODRAFT_155964 [Helobdella robusta]
MPQPRIERKIDQLKNMIRPVLYFSKKIESIVDFCAGSGQLGVLINCMLPNHNIILVENKEESIIKAKQLAMNQKNITIHQTNLDHFQQSFDLGICLHGCGFVSDFVLQKCINQRSFFVICPCCYGSIKETSKIKYPQSKMLQQVFSHNEFITIAHSADQTQQHTIKEEIGKTCMSIVDLDRSLKAQENDYKTFVYKMQPESCSPKNNLIIGIPLEKC